jgi:hypothetical protein
LYQITLGKEKEPTDDENEVKWDNKNEKACKLIEMSISPDLSFHLQGINALDEAWKKLQVVFGKHDIIQSYQLENQLMNLSPNEFSCIEYYLSKFKTLRILCIDCKIDLKEDRCIYGILSKLDSAYSIFVSTFYATREALGSAYKEPSLESFCDDLIHKQDNLV